VPKIAKPSLNIILGLEGFGIGRKESNPSQKNSRKSTKIMFA
jgi:hypothetical protein